jgi:ketosteroid isomerase-like protein
VVSFYAPDAVVIRGDGQVLKGQEEIRTSFVEGPGADTARLARKLSIESDTVRVFGNTAWDVGTSRTSRAGSAEEVSRYLVIFRRGLKA